MYEYRATETIKLNVNGVETPKTRYLHYNSRLALQFLNMREKNIREYTWNTLHTVRGVNVNATWTIADQTTDSNEKQTIARSGEMFY